MTTFLICWYALGWATLGLSALHLGRVSRGDIFIILGGGFGLLIMGGAIMFDYLERIDWERNIWEQTK